MRDDDRGLVAWLPRGSEQARHELVVARAWPLDEGWVVRRPPAEWDVPLTINLDHRS